MDIASIEKFLDSSTKKSKVVQVHFKGRATVTGIIVAMRDYGELKSKNYWRLVTAKNIEKWEKTNDVELSRLFSGSSFTRLSAAEK